MKFILDAVGSSLKNLKVLDVGCGGGILCEPMSRLGALVTGIDENKKASASDPDELEVGLGETGDEFSGAKTVAERTQEGLDVIDKLIAQGKIEGKGRNTTNN